MQCYNKAYFTLPAESLNAYNLNRLRFFHWNKDQSSLFFKDLQIVPNISEFPLTLY